MIVQLRNLKNNFCWTVKSQRHTKGTFMSIFSNESFFQYRCVEAALPFRAVAQRLIIGGLKKWQELKVV